MATIMAAFGGLLILVVITGLAKCQEDECTNYVNMTMYNGKRSADYTTSPSDTAICDYQKYDEGDWVRFSHVTGNRITEECVASGRCGTDAPIWMDGTHPLTINETVTRSLCIAFSGICCSASQEVNVTYCPGSYYVYQVRALPGCPVGYCMHPLNPCGDGQTWSYTQDKCIGNALPSLDEPTTFWSPQGVELKTVLNFSDDDRDDVTSGFYHQPPSGVSLWYNGQLTVEASQMDNITITIQLTDSRQGSSVYELQVLQHECACQNGGTCLQNDVHSPTTLCQCLSLKYFGDLCEKVADTCGSGYCQYGTCVSGVCECRLGYHGDSCEKVQSEWSEWGACSKDCDFGTRTRLRSCATGVCHDKGLCSPENCKEEDVKGVVVEFRRGVEDLERILLDDDDLVSEWLRFVAHEANRICDDEGDCCEGEHPDDSFEDLSRYPYVTEEDIRTVPGYPRISTSNMLRFKIASAEKNNLPIACGGQVGKWSLPLEVLKEATEKYMRKSVAEGRFPAVHNIWLDMGGPDGVPGLSVPAILGIVLACVAGVILIGIAIWLFCKKWVELTGIPKHISNPNHRVGPHQTNVGSQQVIYKNHSETGKGADVNQVEHVYASMSDAKHALYPESRTPPSK